MSNDYQNEDCMLIEEDDEYSSSSCNHGIDSMNPEIEQNKNCILNPDSSPEQILRSVGFFNDILATGISSYIDLVISTGVIPAICKYLFDYSDPDLLYESVKVICRIAEASAHYRDIIIDLGCIEYLVERLNSPSCNVQSTTIVIVLLCCLCCECDGIPPNFEKVKVVLPVVKKYLTSEEEDIVMSACWLFLNMTNGNKAITECVLDMDVLPIIVKHLGDKDVIVIRCALQFIENACTIDSFQIKQCVKYNLLSYLEQLVNSFDEIIVYHSLICLSLIILSGEQPIQRVIDRNLIPYCIERIQSDNRQFQKGACIVLCSVLFAGTPHQILAVLSCRNSLGALCTLLRNDEDIGYIKMIIKALDLCLDLGDDLQRQQHSCTNEIRALMDVCGCLNAVKNLTIDDDDVRNMVNAFISKSNRCDNICDSGMKIQNNSVIKISDRKRGASLLGDLPCFKRYATHPFLDQQLR